MITSILIAPNKAQLTCNSPWHVRNLHVFYNYLERNVLTVVVSYSILITDTADSGGRAVRRGSETARLLGLRVRIPLGRHGCLSVVSVVCCKVEVSVTGRGLLQSVVCLRVAVKPSY